jgi:hypothetical protein
VASLKNRSCESSGVVAKVHDSIESKSHGGVNRHFRKLAIIGNGSEMRLA